MMQRRSTRRSRAFTRFVGGAVVVVLLALGLAVIFWALWRGDEGPGQPPAPQAAPEVAKPAESGAPPPAAASGASPESALAAVESEPLPPLDASDDFVRSAAGGISRDPSFAEWLAQRDLIRRFVVSVDNIAEGLSPRKHLLFLKPRGTFLVSDDERGLRIDPAGYRRYDRIAEVFSSLDAKGCAEFYFRAKPLIERCYQDLGYPGLDFDQRLGQAIAELLAVPVAPEAPALVEEVLRYEFADPELEALSDAQKQLLRMGPRNVQRIQGKLRELARATGIPLAE